METQQEVRKVYKVKDRSAKVAKKAAWRADNRRSIQLQMASIAKSAKKAQTGPKGCTSDDPRNHQGVTCPIHESSRDYSLIRMGLR